VLQKTVVLIF